jgi:hypothetical protein
MTKKAENTGTEDLNDLFAGSEKKPAKKAAQKKAASKKTAPKKAEPVVEDEVTAKDEVTEEEIQMHEDPVVDEQLDETTDPRDSWPVIVIDEVNGMPNYETVGLNGEVFQIKRGVEVPVPPGVLGILQNAVGDRIVQSRDPVSGNTETSTQKYSTIPYRVVRWAKM